MSAKIDLTSHRYGRLTVVGEAGKNPHGNYRWECICDCGKTHIVPSGHLRSGHTKSCGCFNIEQAIKQSTIHGKRWTPEYNTWAHMIQRCYNRNNKRYQDYGGRGITICKKWRENFLNFYHDMGQKPSTKFSIERKNNDGNYEPGNCLWATPMVQKRNQRVYKINTSGTSGVIWCKSSSKWKATISVNYKKIHLGYFTNLQDAVNARKEAEHEYWHV